MVAKRAPTGQLRIIGGQWKRRRLSFPAEPGLRPTADRVRETLFNWLQFDITGRRCLDLFAGSGACGLEALSRGAAFVRFVERSAPVANALRVNLGQLDVAPDRASVVQADALSWLQSGNTDGTFDLVFVDPPYAEGLLLPALNALQQSALLSPAAIVYIEDRQPLTALLPSHWYLRRSSRAGAVYFGLCQLSPPSN